MPLRKTRIPCQGLANQPQLTLISNKSTDFLKTQQNPKLRNSKKDSTLSKTSTNKPNASTKYSGPQLQQNRQNYFTSSQTSNDYNSKSEMNLTNHNQNFDTQMGKYKQLLFSKGKNTKTNNQMQQLSKILNPKAINVLQKIRSAYKYNANVRKIIKAWGFQNNGCITDKHFQQTIKKHFDQSITSEDCQELMNGFSHHKQNLDLLSFIKLVFDSKPFTKPNVQVLNEFNLHATQSQDGPTKTLTDKIKDLNEASLFKRLDENKQKKVILPQLRNRSLVLDTKTSSSFLLQRNTSFCSNTQPSLYQTLCHQSSPKFTFSSTKSHAINFTPTMFQGKNQQKTRFNATPLIHLNDQSSPEHKRQKIVDQKYKVVQQLSNQRNLQKIRYQNKLNQIRQYQQQQKQNVFEIDRKTQQRDHANMKRFRQQNIAYNYVNFIHNDWK